MEPSILVRASRQIHSRDQPLDPSKLQASQSPKASFYALAVRAVGRPNSLQDLPHPALFRKPYRKPYHKPLPQLAYPDNLDQSLKYIRQHNEPCRSLSLPSTASATGDPNPHPQPNEVYHPRLTPPPRQQRGKALIAHYTTLSARTQTSSASERMTSSRRCRRKATVSFPSSFPVYAPTPSTIITH